MRIRTAKDLYNELLKSFYFGVYRKDDNLMTYKEAHEVYGLAKNTIGAAYTMLRQDGFICTDGKKGIIVTFDRNNPDHVSKVPLEWLGAGQGNMTRYEITMRLHANALYMGLMASDEEHLQKYEILAKEILNCIQEGTPYTKQILTLWMDMVSAINNGVITTITRHFITRYFYLTPLDLIAAGQRESIYNSALSFHQYLQRALEKREFSDLLKRFWQYYNEYYQAGGVMFSKLEVETLYVEQALYGKLVDALCIKIASGGLEKGDALPTTAHLCKEYGVSKTTVNRAYGTLMEMGVITRRARSGTKLAAHPNDPAIRERLEEVVGLHRQDWQEAIDAISMINHILNQCVSVSPKTLGEMREELRRQKEMFEVYDKPFIVSSILIGPLITGLPYGILHKYYFYLIDILNRIMTLCMFHICGHEEHGREIHQLMDEALNVLENGNQEQFAVLVERAIRRNLELCERDFCEDSAWEIE